MMAALPAAVSTILKKLENSGFSSYVVGGAVRDLLMGKEPQDYDLASSATPSEVLALFQGCAADTGGRRYGTVSVSCMGMTVEVTTFRSESGYTDRRRPDEVQFETDIAADLSRRDFTVNAIAWNPNQGLVDPFGGAEDIRRRILRTVGDPQRRFSEDALRVYRFFRFAARLGFEMDPPTLQKAQEAIPSLKTLPSERILKELSATLNQSYLAPLNYAVNHGFYAHIGLHQLRQGERIGLLPHSTALRFAVLCLLADIRPADLIQNLRCSNELATTIMAFYDQLTLPLPRSAYELKKRWPALPPTYWDDLLEARAQLLGESTDEPKSLLLSILQKNEPWNRSMLQISGSELIRAGFQGRQIGQVLDILLDRVLADPDLNRQDLLLKMAGDLQGQART